jgi:hypothetical protein
MEPGSVRCFSKKKTSYTLVVSSLGICRHFLSQKTEKVYSGHETENIGVQYIS